MNTVEKLSAEIKRLRRLKDRLSAKLTAERAEGSLTSKQIRFSSNLIGRLADQISYAEKALRDLKARRLS